MPKAARFMDDTKPSAAGVSENSSVIYGASTELTLPMNIPRKNAKPNGIQSLKKRGEKNLPPLPPILSRLLFRIENIIQVQTGAIISHKSESGSITEPLSL